jgi:CxxC motif-containing protein (DUF1111 family)
MKTGWMMIAALAAANALAQSEPEVFAQPIPGLSDGEREQFFRGRTLVRQSWVVAPSKDDQVDGLGPLYNRLACISCHPRNGRGRPPERDDERMLSMLVRLSVPGHDAHGGPKPHPAYGGQLNEEGIPGVPGEGRAALRWQDVETLDLDGGERVSLRLPAIEFSDLAYGPIDGVLTSPRVGQQMVGLGLLDAVPETTLRQLAKERKPDGVAGRVNRVWNPETRRMEVGRFGYKANMPTLRTQAAGAFLGDMGITSAAFPTENCTAVQKACRKAPTGGSPELSKKQLDDVEFYLAHLEVPERRNADDPKVLRGEARFGELGCAACHRTELKTAERSRFPRLSGRTISAYTDLLIHDMGEGLSDHRPDYRAGGREWRTPPLWGLGRTATVSESTFYLHDGRARTLAEAILWHGGEARAARDRFVRLPKQERDILLAFLQSL